MTSEVTDPLDTQAQLQTLARRLNGLLDYPVIDSEWAGEMFQVTSALQTMVAVAALTMGECRQDTPYAPLKPVLDANGNFKWCCDHPTEHCSK